MSIEVELGEMVKDEVTGFVGKVTGIATYLYTTKRVLVESIELFDGDTKSEWFDIARLREV